MIKNYDLVYENCIKFCKTIYYWLQKKKLPAVSRPKSLTFILRFHICPKVIFFHTFNKLLHFLLKSFGMNKEIESAGQ